MFFESTLDMGLIRPCQLKSCKFLVRSTVLWHFIQAVCFLNCLFLSRYF